MSDSVIDRICDRNQDPCLKSSLHLAPPPPPRPPWLPEGEGLKKLPPALQFAADRSIVPLWDEVVVRADTAVERSAGETFVYVAWLEIQQQVELAGGQQAESPVDVAEVLDRLLRVSRFKFAAGDFLMRVSENWKSDNRRRYLESVREGIEEGLEEMRQENDEFRKLIERKNSAAKAESRKAPGVETRGPTVSPPAVKPDAEGDPLWVVKDGPDVTRRPYSYESRYLTDSETCPTCRGGRAVPCPDCRGTGRV